MDKKYSKFIKFFTVSVVSSISLLMGVQRSANMSEKAFQNKMHAVEQALYSLQQEAFKNQEYFGDMKLIPESPDMTAIIEGLSVPELLYLEQRVKQNTRQSSSSDKKEQNLFLGNKLFANSLSENGSFPEWVGKFLEVLNSDQLSSEQKIAVKKAISTLFVDSENIEISLGHL